MDASSEGFRVVLCYIWTNDDYATTGTPEPPLEFVSRGVKDWETDYMSDQIFRSLYVKVKAAEEKKQEEFWIDSVATLQYHIHAGDCNFLPESRLLQVL